MEGPEAGRAYVLEPDVSTIGRDSDSDIFVEDSAVSRRHARIVAQGARLVIQDLNSRNGTFLREQSVALAEIRDGDMLRIGPHVTFGFQRLAAAQLSLLQRLYESSTCDGLTGVFNKKHFQQRLAGEVAYCRRHGSDLGLLMIDIDHFKHVNDTYGHPAGDAVLCQVAKCISTQIRTEDILARVGGEEFAVVLRGIALDGSARLAERLRAAVAALPCHHRSGETVSVTISLGCAALRGADVTAGVLIAVADERLYEAKRRGRNCVQATNFCALRQPNSR